MQFETLDYVVPTTWIPALINDDRTGLEEYDEECLTAFCQGEVGGMRRQGWRFHGWSLGFDDPSFCWKHDGSPYGALPSDCYQLTACFAK
jgi:hypothetical protein